MIRSREQLAEIARQEAGDLREIPFAVILMALALDERTVVLELRRRHVKKEIVIEYGDPVDCRSNLLHETLGRFMVAQGKLRPEVQDDCLRESIRRGVAIGDVLRERELVSPAELYRLMQQNLAKRLLDGFSWSDGEYTLRSDPPIVESPLRVRVAQLIVTGVSKLAPQEEVNAGVWPVVGKPLALDSQSLFPIDGLLLSGNQRKIRDLLRKPRTMKEVSEASGLSFDEVTRLTYAFAIIGAVSAAEELPQPEAEAEDAAPPTTEPATGLDTVPGAEPAVVAVDSFDPAEAEKIHNRVMEAYLSYRKQDAFDLLQVPEDATVAAIREKFLTFAHSYAPWRYYRQPEMLPIAEKAQDLFLAGAKGFGELMNAEQRNTLLYRRKVLAEERQKPVPSQPPIRTELLDSEKQYRKGRTLMEEGQYRDAYELLEFAADCDPQNGLYGAEAAYCYYHMSPRSREQECLSRLQEVLRLDPKCGIAAFYAGEIASEAGDLEQAESFLRRANQLMAPDRRPIEALKSLSRRSKKR